MHLSVLSVRSEKILLYLEHNYLKRNGFQCKNTTDKWKNCDRWQISLLETDEKKKKRNSKWEHCNFCSKSNSTTRFALSSVLCN